MFTITITVNSIERKFTGDYDDVYNLDWEKQMRDLIDTVKDNQDAESI